MGFDPSVHFGRPVIDVDDVARGPCLLTDLERDLKRLIGTKYPIQRMS